MSALFLFCAEHGHDYRPSVTRSQAVCLECSRCGSRISPCPLLFKSSSCGYVGPETECDKSPQACRRLGNFERYLGFPMPNARDE